MSTTPPHLSNFLENLNEIERSLKAMSAVRVHPNDLFLHSAHCEKISGHLAELHARPARLTGKPRDTRADNATREEFDCRLIPAYRGWECEAMTADGDTYVGAGLTVGTAVLDAYSKIMDATGRARTGGKPRGGMGRI